MTPSDLAQASTNVKIGVLWFLLVAAVCVILVMAIWLVQARMKIRQLRSRELASTRTVSLKTTEAEELKTKLTDAETQAGAALKEMRRATAIRLKAERKLRDQNSTVDRLRTERNEARKDRDWFKRFVDHVET